MIDMQKCDVSEFFRQHEENLRREKEIEIIFFFCENFLEKCCISR